MAKAKLVLSNGTVIQINGSSEEIAKIMALHSDSGALELDRKESAKQKSVSKKEKAHKKKSIPALIMELKDENFFKNRQSLVAVQKKLEEKGYIYSQGPVGKALLILVKKGELGRVRGKGVAGGRGKQINIWCYVNR